MNIFCFKGLSSLQSIAESFVSQLFFIQSYTKKFKRVAKTAISKSVSGKVDWLKTYRRQKAEMHNDVISTVRTASYDISENALIAAAAQKIVSFYSQNTKEFEILYPWVKMANSFQHSYRDLYSMQLRLNAESLSGAHAFYYTPVMLSKVILGFCGVNYLADETNTILFNINRMFLACPASITNSPF